MKNYGPYLLALLFLGPANLAAQTSPNKPAALPIEKMRAAIYTKEFAQRFALPDPQPDSEPRDGVQAMEFSVEEGPKSAPYYYCKLALYLDSKLSIAYPEGDVGVHYIPSKPSYLMSPDDQRWSKWSVEDRKYLNEKKALYNRRAALASDDYVWRKHGLFTDMTYDEYRRELFPNLAYIKLDMGCPTAAWGERHQALQIWLKRDGAPDYTRQIKIEPEHFLKFSLPQPYFQKIVGWIKAVADYNARISEEDIRLNRERRRRESAKRLDEMFRELK